jgi:hypothetical protein
MMLDFKLSSIVIILMMFFIAKISLESMMTEKVPEGINDRSPASIDQSYNDHLNKR